MNRISLTYNYRYLVLGIILVIPVLGSLIQIFDSTIELGTVHLYSVIWIFLVATFVYFSFTNEVYENTKILLVKNGILKKMVEWKNINAISDIKEPKLAYGNTIFTKYRKFLEIHYNDNCVRIYYKYNQDVQQIKEMIKARLKIEIERHSYKADILHRVLDMIVE